MSLTVQQVADRLQCSVRFVQDELINRGEGPLAAWRLGRHWRVEEDDLQSFIQGRKTRTSPVKSSADRLKAIEGGRR